jgi:galactonate dehydratase
MHYNSEAGEEDLLTYMKDKSAFNIEDGYVRALEGPDLGVEVDEEAVRRISKET